MNIISVLVDEDFNLNSIPFNDPRIRYGARGIVKRQDGKIAIFNKSNKNEYKLPGGGIDDNEDPKEAFLREVLEETGCVVKIITKLGTIEEHKTLDNFKQISHVYVSEVIEDKKTLYLTQKEQDEGAKLLWLDEHEALEKISDCSQNLKESAYENFYHSRFIVERDRRILSYYLENNKKRLN